MGAGNVTAALVYWSDLDDQPMRLLVHMAVVALDEPRHGSEARRYFGGRRAMAEALFGPLPSDEATDTYSVQRLAAVYRRTTRIVAQLIKVGAIKVARREGRGRSREYALLLDRDTGNGWQ